MKHLYPLYGIVTVLNTPFRKDHGIDFKALGQNVEEAIRAGVAGFLVPAMASEVRRLSNSERFSMVDCVLKSVNGRVPVFAGTAANSVAESKRLMKSYLSLGCAHMLIQLPFDNRDQFREDFFELAESGAEVIMLQDWDANGYGLADELILELFEKIPEFRCLKVETAPAGVKYSNILRLTDGKLNVSGGWAVMQLPEAFRRGVHAFMPTGMHWIYTRIHNLYRDGNPKAAVRLFHEILPVLAFSNQHLDISIHFFKRLLWKQGVYPAPIVREPILPFDEIHRETADQLIEKVMEIEERIKNCEL
ncbi:MAG: dihydrodipicolinate synthase family protein [Cytophagales bacterium]|nr:dihydrodipicolinate synthase family protein [Cytophagales bacterium]